MKDHKLTLRAIELIQTFKILSIKVVILFQCRKTLFHCNSELNHRTQNVVQKTRLINLTLNNNLDVT